MGKNHDIIMRHILEVRLRKRLFSFMDFRGRMVEYTINALNTNQIRLQNNSSRFDVADDKMENLYFFGFENFGFQSELKTSFDDFKSITKKFIDTLKAFPDYKINEGLVRVGTRSIILYHRKFDNTQSIKEAYKDVIINNHKKISELTKSKIVDTAYTFDLKLENSKANVLTGPVTKKEAQAQFFDGKTEYSEQFKPENGMLLSIDVFGDDSISIKDLDALEKQINTQILDIESVFNGFKVLFGGTSD